MFVILEYKHFDRTNERIVFADIYISQIFLTTILFVIYRIKLDTFVYIYMLRIAGKMVGLIELTFVVDTQRWPGDVIG